ncbi:MAG: TauD/TfdA family dioxygenase [Methylococcales bacterium]
MIKYVRDDRVCSPAVAWLITEGQEHDLDTVCAWLQAQRVAIEDILNTSGGLLIRGFKHLKTAADFEKAITTLAPDLRDYVSGASPRRVVKDKIMTSTEAPPPWSIPIHQEMAYIKNPPDRIAFFCEYPATTGGESTLCDMHSLVAKIRPDVKEKFSRYGYRIRRTLATPAVVDNKPGIQKTWTEAFATTDKSVVEQAVKDNGWVMKWLEDGSLQIWQDVIPALKHHPVSDKPAWYSLVQIYNPAASLAWMERDGRTEDYQRFSNAMQAQPELLDNIFYGNGEAIADDDALHIAEVIRDSEVKALLKASDLLVLDNMLIGHGRMPYSGDRRILVALIDVPEFKQASN